MIYVLYYVAIRANHHCIIDPSLRPRLTWYVSYEKRSLSWRVLVFNSSDLIGISSTFNADLFKVRFSGLSLPLLKNILRSSPAPWIQLHQEMCTNAQVQVKIPGDILMFEIRLIKKVEKQKTTVTLHNAGPIHEANELWEREDQWHLGWLV